MSNVLSYIIEAKDKATEVLNKVKGSISGMGETFGSIKQLMAGAFTAGSIVAFGKSVMDTAGRIKDAAAATGFSTDRFQALSIAAKENGVGMDQLSGALGRLRNAQGQIGDNKGLQETFAKIGMSVEDVQNADPEQLLEGIAKGLKSTGDASVAFDVFGRGASTLLSTLNELSAGWDPLVAKMQQGIISEADIARLDELGDILDNTSIKAKAWGATAAGVWADISGVLGRMSAGEGITEATDNLIEQKNKDRQARIDARKAEEEARKQSLKDQKAKQDAASLVTEQKTGATIENQYAKATLSDKEYEARLQQQLDDAVAATMQDGLSALELQKRKNEALKIELELLELQKKMKDDVASEEKKTMEEYDKQFAKEQEGIKKLADAKQAAADYEMSKQDSGAQLRDAEKRIADTRAQIATETDPEKKAGLIEQQIKNVKERDEIKKTREERKQALADMDKELRDATLTPQQRLEESQKRQYDLQKQIKTMPEGDKKDELEKKLREELKLQVGLTKEVETARPREQKIGLENVFDKMRGQDKKRNPQEVTNDHLKEIAKILADINKKRGGMAP